MKSQNTKLPTPKKPLRMRLSESVDDVAQSVGRAYAALLIRQWRRQAEHNRSRFAKKYIAIVGSCGKSTTTMLTGKLLGAQMPVEVGLFNNTERHSYRTLRYLNRPVDYVVQEVTEFPVGTIAKVMRATRPDCGVITSAGLDHLTEFRSNEAVAAELATLSRDCPIICLNADDANVRALAATAKGRVVTFGTNAGADVRAENVSSQLPGRLHFDLVIEGVKRPVQTRFAGTLMLTNLLGALAVVHAQGLDLDRAIQTLAETDPARGRLSVHEGLCQHTIILDTVKAPLWSTRLLVDDLKNMGAGRRVFVLGGLSDTGSGGSSARYRQVMKAATAECDLVIGMAGAASTASKLAGQHGTSRIMSAGTLAEVAELLLREPPSMVVVKGNALSKQIDGFLKALRAGSLPPAQAGEQIAIDPV